jgi:membrane associated rhomboid family serine protease
MMAIRTIILINVAVFLAWGISSTAGMESLFMENNFLVSWQGLAEGRYWILLTSVFSHNMLFHLLINMFVLNSFGPIVLQSLGLKRFLQFYLGAGIFSSFCHAAVSAWVLHQPELPALGASGAIAGLILLFSLLYPREKILLLGVIPMPAIWGALAFVALDLWGLFAQANGGGLPIGHGAHLGGALAGFLYYLYIKKNMVSRYY